MIKEPVAILFSHSKHRGSKMFLFLCTIFLLGAEGVGGTLSRELNHPTCDFIDNAPVIETEIPSYLHNIKVLGDLDVKVYRHSLTDTGLTKPRLKGELKLQK